MDKLPLDKVEWLTKLPIEEITWEDHYSTDDWLSPDDKELHSNIYVTSIGYLLKETKTKIVLVFNKATNGNIFGTTTILKKTVKSRVTIREAQ